MQNKIKFSSRFSSLYLFFIVFAVLSFITRTVLFFKALSELDPTLWLVIRIYAVGLFFDVIAMTYFAIPFVLYLTLVPDKIFLSKAHKYVLYLFVFLTTYVLTFNSFAEYIFFDEFGARFNFIAVDYLVYTTEVIKNIRESYPIPALLAGIAAISFLIFMSVKRPLDASLSVESTLKQRAQKGIAFLLVPLASFFFIDPSLTRVSANNYANELSANSIYNLFSAFRNNQINYNDFYKTRDDLSVSRDLRMLLQDKDGPFVTGNIFDINRTIRNNGKEKKLNVVVVVVESLSAEYLGVFGNEKQLSPNLDALAKKGLFFTNFHATGTRTDRGLEAITLSVPPTPGRSIVKRIDNENMFSWGFLMKDRGYDTKFIYGGYGYFDNMNYFFSHNGFDTVDRTDFKKNEIIFENAWGVSDEDLFSKAIAEFNKAYGKGKPFFSVVMTTSNHRPYTYPDGRIDIPSKSGRDGAVKYADYAIGKFLRESEKEPWAKDTVFVIVADHCAGSAGKVALPVKKYEIPLFIYSPAHIAPATIDKLASQIDLAPTLLGLLNFTYQSRFFGRDILKMGPEHERAFIGTYQKLGYLKEDRLVVLDVKKETSLYQFKRSNGKTKKIPPDQRIIAEAISYYQGADYLYKNRLNRRDSSR